MFLNKFLITGCLIFLLGSTMSYADEVEDKFNAILTTEEQLYQQMQDFINVLEDPKTKKNLTNIYNSVDKLFEEFIKRTQILTSNITDPDRVYRQKLKLSEAFFVLLDRYFIKAQDKASKATTLEANRNSWFERALYVFLKAKLMTFNYYISMKAQKTEKLDNYYRTFQKYYEDLTDFINEYQDLYKNNSVFLKRVILIEDQVSGSSGYLSKNAVSQGDLGVLITFLQGKYKDNQGIYVKNVSYKQKQVEGETEKGLVLFMNYQPISNNIKIINPQEVLVTVTGDNLEDILTYVINEASSIMNMKINSKQQKQTLTTKEIDYKKYTEESIMLSQVAVLRAILVKKTEIKNTNEEKKEGAQQDPENVKKTLEVTLKVKVGFIKQEEKKIVPPAEKKDEVKVDEKAEKKEEAPQTKPEENK